MWYSGRLFVSHYSVFRRRVPGITLPQLRNVSASRVAQCQLEYMNVAYNKIHSLDSLVFGESKVEKSLDLVDVGFFGLALVLESFLGGYSCFCLDDAKAMFIQCKILLTDNVSDQSGLWIKNVIHGPLSVVGFKVGRISLLF